MGFNKYRLTKWRRLLLVRDCITEDGVRRAYCPMCHATYPIWRLQTHHIYPKAVHPEKAYQLDNGICLCLACHMHVTHAGNSFKDVEELSHWRFFVPTFNRYVQLANQRQFNINNQNRV